MGCHWRSRNPARIPFNAASIIGVNEMKYSDVIYEMSDVELNSFLSSNETVKAIWNRAIEEAARVCYDGGSGDPITTDQIRELKIGL